MQSNISILGTACIVQSIRVDGQGIDGSKVSLDASKFFFVNQPKESRFELSDFTGRRCDTHGFLSTTQQDVIFGFTDNGIVDGPVRLVRFQVFQIDGVVQFGRKVSAGCNEHGLVSIELYSVDLLFVCPELFFNVARVGIVQANHAIVKGHEQMLVQVGPPDIGGIDAFGMFLGDVNFQNGSRRVRFDVKDGNLGVVFDKGVRDSGKGPVVF
mmetsp:Transcript_23578/g.43828  ORF Transcript_23578/g.43828 Transcript_23578/m.43828 type:complete len:212 (-) Transcript_23578:295-930(-)